MEALACSCRALDELNARPRRDFRARPPQARTGGDCAVCTPNTYPRSATIAGPPRSGSVVVLGLLLRSGRSLAALSFGIRCRSDPGRCGHANRLAAHAEGRGADRVEQHTANTSACAAFVFGNTTMTSSPPSAYAKPRLSASSAISLLRSWNRARAPRPSFA